MGWSENGLNQTPKAYGFAQKNPAQDLRFELFKFLLRLESDQAPVCRRFARGTTVLDDHARDRGCGARACFCSLVSIESVVLDQRRSRAPRSAAGLRLVDGAPQVLRVPAQLIIQARWSCCC